ncbi:winged helix DNA-binding domain-containing protein [Isoptericola sp. S6320L]|uniref:winged helix DNA-binding domain-containing protein n=1 Tax=Isoptericola sp. S6320L TaxID=2926411 RepID=UPI001FF4C06A|nr:winged helix DNA-binding domain-containing protein [Isoptericola sp. S6320L]MCK0118455.1 winged helix DNA-binding domain-containing protein [Isoptericola sp. S6320L]
MSVDAVTVRAARLRAQRLREPDLPDLPSAVGHLLAVQGQELRPTLWGLSRRLAPGARTGEAPQVTEPAALRALDEGAFLRTHVLRPTWHLVRPDDARWLLELTAPRVARTMASTEKQWGIGDPTAAIDAVADEVALGARTRPELAAALVARGLVADDAPGIVVTHVLMHAELRCVVVSGPTAQGQHTYVTFDERVPHGYGPLGGRFDREAAVLELWRRYLPGRAYATAKDLGQWCGLTLAELRAGLAVLLDTGEAVLVPGRDGLDGAALVSTPELHDAATRPTVPQQDVALPAAAPPSGPVVDLLCGYDEVLASYRETRGVLGDPRAPEPGRIGAFVHTVAVDGLLAARWRWPARPPHDGEVEVQWQRDPEPSERAAVRQAATALAAYLDAAVAG